MGRGSFPVSAVCAGKGEREISSVLGIVQESGFAMGRNQLGRMIRICFFPYVHEDPFPSREGNTLICSPRLCIIRKP